MSTPVELHQRIRLAREDAGLTQGQLAKLLDVSRPTVSDIEGGRRKISAEELGKMADLFGVSTEWLLGRDQSAGMSQDLLLAARHLEKLSSSDLDRVLDLLRKVKGTPE
jgi:transcriptional regulator with XRE-family HTH domain